jgi:hypothetical protein
MPMGFAPIKNVPDGEYLLARCTTQAALAAKASTAQAAAAHRRIASCYLAKLFATDNAASPEVESSHRTWSPSDGYGTGGAQLRFYQVSMPRENKELIGLLQNLG